MKPTFAAVALSLLLFSCAGGGAPPAPSGNGHTDEEHKQFVIDSVLFLNNVNEIMSGVTDVPSAKAARPKLDALIDPLMEIKARRKLLGLVPDALKKDPDFARNQTEVMKQWGLVTQNMSRILQIAGGVQALGPSMSKILTFFNEVTPE